ncbi:uncharacterized protein FIBRA_09292 [Fibroporia radiculosa]|uniref:Uncharacterized protein n=1 Tax=Fibroporia radiculosa TaxID=599839 RepID=J7RHC0_9APHY|nr:uncharacterized protein FIBRA_09292 [Fibroporia radiculosa]CCM06977.1 predicted protein [Fibroporia radiculosa]
MYKIPEQSSVELSSAYPLTITKPQQINSLLWEVSLHTSQFAQDLQEARTHSPLTHFPFFGSPTEQLQFVEGQLASLAAGGLNTPTEEELFQEYIGLAETLREY